MGGGGGWWWMPPLDKVFLEDKTPAPVVFSSCSIVPRAHFEDRFSDVWLLWLRDMSYVAGGQANLG